MNPSLFALSENLFTAFGLDRLEPAKQEEALKQIGDIVFQRIMLRLAEVLSEAQMNQFDQSLLREEQEPGSVMKFLQAEVPNVGSLIDEEVAGFKEEALDLVRSIT